MAVAAAPVPVGDVIVTVGATPVVYPVPPSVTIIESTWFATAEACTSACFNSIPVEFESVAPCFLTGIKFDDIKSSASAAEIVYINFHK